MLTGGYQMVDLSGLGGLNLSGGTVTVNTTKEVVDAIKQNKKVVLLQGMYLVNNSVTTYYSGFCHHTETAGIKYQNIGNVSIYPSGDTQLTVRVN